MAQQPYYPPQGAYAQPGYQQMPQQPPKKSGNGCLWAVLIICGLGLVAVGVAGYVGYRAYKSSPELQAAVEIAEIVLDSQDAEGTSELRKEAGCKTAYVMDMARLMKVSKVFDAGVEDAPENMPAVVVVCQVPVSAAGPTCDEVAKTYVDAVGTASGDFAAVVTKGDGGKNNACEMLYDKHGKSKGSFDSSSAPVPDLNSQ